MKIYDFKIIRSISRYFRQNRMNLFNTLLLKNHAGYILDVGGFVENWRFLQKMPNLIILNIHPPFPGYDLNGSFWIVGDGKVLPFKDKQFEVAFSNSVIEHLGDLEDQKKFAQEIARVGKSYFVQTPNRWFFMDPHLMLPFVHFLPRLFQRMIVNIMSRWGIIYIVESATTNMLSYGDMKKLFPDAKIVREKFWGMTKSLVAIRS